MNDKTKAFLEEKLDGLRLARECELAVVKYLEKYKNFFDEKNKNKKPICRTLLRAVRRYLEGQSQVKEFSREIEHIRAILNIPDAPEASEVPEWVKIHTAPAGTTYELQPKIGVP